MPKAKENKTNAMRILDSMHIPYQHQSYECKDFVDGVQVADRLGLPRPQVFKTLVTVGQSRSYFVFVIPVAEELDLKRAAASVGEKSVELIAVRDINRVTGYIRGGCTAIGMKKQYVTRLDSSAQHFSSLYISGGRLGSQLQLSPADFLRATGAEYATLTRTDRSNA